ncbi:MAG: outer membrane beta-barrel protein, partial [Pseudomonadota bacterium]
PGISENELSSTEVYRVDVGLTYFLNRNVNISGGYSWEDQSSNIADFEYTSNRFFLVLGLTL